MRAVAARRLLMAAVLALAIGAAGCGGSTGNGSGSGGNLGRSEDEADAGVLNAAIAREMTLTAAYDHGLELPAVRRGRAAASRLALLKELRAHSLEHVDALTKALRGVGGTVEAEAESLEYDGVGTWPEFLSFAYGLESRTINAHLKEIAQLAHPWPRSLLGSVVGGEAQQLVLMRQALGAKTSAASVPEAFEAGRTEPPATGPNPLSAP